MMEQRKVENGEIYAEFFAGKVLYKIPLFKGYPECEHFHTKNL